jgi:hypothetical protein
MLLQPLYRQHADGLNFQFDKRQFGNLPNFCYYWLNLVLADIPEVKGVALSDLLHDFLTTNADIAVCWSLEPLQLAQP